MPAEKYGLFSKNFHHSSDFPILSQSTIACALEQHLLNLHKFTYRLDGDNVRFGLNKDLGFDEKSRNENIRRIGEVSKDVPSGLLAADVRSGRCPNYLRTQDAYPSPPSYLPIWQTES